MKRLFASSQWESVSLILLIVATMFVGLFSFILLLTCLNAGLGMPMGRNVCIAVLPALLVRHYYRPWPHWWPRFARTSLYGIALGASLPIWCSLSPFLVYKRQMHMDGEYYDSGELLFPSGPALPALYHYMDYALSLSGALLLIGLGLTLHLAATKRLGLRQLRLLCLMFILAWLPLLLNPCGFMEWIMD